MTELTAGPDDQGRRLDRVLRRVLPGVPLSALHRAFRKRRIRVDGRRARPEHRLSRGETITLPPGLASEAVVSADDPQEHTPVMGVHGEIPENKVARRIHTAHKPGQQLEVLIQGPDLIAVNKPVGISTHGPGSLQHLVAQYSRARSNRSLAFRPAPLHRLDRHTSGVVICAATIEGAQRFSQLLRARQVSKWYLALLDGIVPKGTRWEDRLERDGRTGRTQRAGSGRGQEATAEVTPLLHNSDAKLTLAAVRLITGRRHQIRAQAALRGVPLLGDSRYSPHSPHDPHDRGHLLHAAAVVLEHGEGLLGSRSVSAPLPETARRRIQRLFGEAAPQHAQALLSDLVRQGQDAPAGSAPQ